MHTAQILGGVHQKSEDGRIVIFRIVQRSLMLLLYFWDFAEFSFIPFDVINQNLRQPLCKLR